MSSTTVINDSNPISICAACGKVDDNLKACTACHLVKYCNRECQIAHRPKHKKECRKRAAELKHTRDNNTPNRNVDKILSEGISNVNISETSTNAGDKKVSTSCEQKTEQNNNGNSNVDTEATTNEDLSRATISDEELFKDPPPKEECPICMQPVPFHPSICNINYSYQACCGKVICSGCMATAAKEMAQGRMKPCCPFCRLSVQCSKEEFMKRVKRRMKLNEDGAYFELGCAYENGINGLPQDDTKAFDLFNQAAKLGSCKAHRKLADAYYHGRGVEQDVEKTLHHWKLAAIGGHEIARYNLGTMEEDISKAVKHFTIAARSGFDESLKAVGDGYKNGFVTKDEYASTLRAYQVSVAEMKSAQRTEAAAIEASW